MTIIDLTGQTFGRLTVIKRADNKNKRTAWLCKCECGNELITTTDNLRSGDTQSCGCYNKERTVQTHQKHGLRYKKLYAVHQSIKARCYNKNNKQYKDYGGRGIVVCDEWLGEHGAENFIKWSLSNGYANNLTIDRIDNDKGYSPNNCRWTTPKEQGNNTRRNHYITYNGETHTLSQWAEILNLNRATLNSRINLYHWDIEKAFQTPCKGGRQP